MRRAVPPAPALRRGGRLLAAVGALLLAGAGCLGYQVGRSLPPGVRSVHVAPFANQTDEPQLETTCAQAALREFQNDGALRVTDADGADARVSVTLTRYGLEAVAYDAAATRTTREMRLTLEGRLLVRGRDGASLVDRTVRGETTFEPGEDLISARRAALPDAARDLARQIVNALVDYW